MKLLSESLLNKIAPATKKINSSSGLLIDNEGGQEDVLANNTSNYKNLMNDINITIKNTTDSTQLKSSNKQSKDVSQKQKIEEESILKK